MLFDVITALILIRGFSVLYRLIGRRRSDVLNYVLESDTRGDR